MNGGDPEIEAMGVISTALSTLPDDEAKSRVLRWAAERYGVTVAAPTKHAQTPTVEPGSDNGSSPESLRPTVTDRVQPELKFNDFVDLFDAVDPKTDVEKALTAAYWLQVERSEPSWQSQKINNALKDTGHGITNVTHALTSAQARKPALVRQMGKSGKSQQARKTYKMTTSGISYVRNKLGLTGAVPAALTDQIEDEA